MFAIPVPDGRISAGELHAFVRRIFESAGSMAREAELVADHLVAANLAGHDSHGVGMIPGYIAALGEQEWQRNAHARVVRDFGAVLTIDGGRGLGQVVAYEAMELGIERARTLGIAAVGLRDAHHIGRIGHWAEQCARAGLASFHFVNVAGDPFVAPFGGMDRRFGTNPFCAAFPRAGQPPLVLDFATSGIAFGKTRVAYNKGESVGAGNLLDHEGRPTTEPKVMHEPPFGTLLPFGGHKGSGLAVMCEILAGAMSGGVTTHARTLVTGSGIINGMMSIIVDPRAFDAPDADAEAEAFIEWVRSARLAPDQDPIQLPGEPERRQQAERTARGIPVDATTWEQIRGAALTAGMPAAEVERCASAYD
ncbi:MAG: malate/lactate/ureidoglycolate dehydrogenase [Janthinobacterium lividum]